jgi:hypothetical protein
MANDPDGTAVLLELFYLARVRYKMDFKTAGIRAADEWSESWKEVIPILRAELATPAGEVNAPGFSDAEIREYLKQLLAAYDEAVNW